MKKEGKLDKSLGNQRERAQSLMELAISFVILVYILSGVVDLGRAFFVLIELRDAAQEGAVCASMGSRCPVSVTTAVQKSATDPIDLENDPDVSVEVCPSGTPCDACAGFTGSGSVTEAYATTIRVIYQFEITMPLIQVMVPSNTIPLSATVSNAVLYPPCP